MLGFLLLIYIVIGLALTAVLLLLVPYFEKVIVEENMPELIPEMMMIYNTLEAIGMPGFIVYHTLLWLPMAIFLIFDIVKGPE